jgi:hypothetical protein
MKLLAKTSPGNNMDKNQLHSTMEREWSGACRVIFKTELGPLSDFEPFLSHYTTPLSKAKSSISGKEVFYSSPYLPGAKFLLLSEQAKLQKAKIDMNDVKDIDSLFRASEEIAYYCGSKEMGNSQHNEVFDNLVDSSFIYKSHAIMKGEYIALSNHIISCKRLFGCSSSGYSSFCISCSEHTNLHRSFQVGLGFYSSELYYCYYMKSCQECMFCINQAAKKFCIGNNQLSKDKYEELKSSLLSQLSDGLKRKKAAPPLVWGN